MADGSGVEEGHRESPGRSHRDGMTPGGPGWSDGFDSDEYREFVRDRRRRARDHDRGGPREDDSDWRGGSSAKAPEWDGTSIPFQDWLIKAKLWLATTKTRKNSQGPMLLQGLSGVAFQTFKHWARDSTWLQNDEGGHELLAAMDLPENFGDDREEDLLSSLAKITYHIRREKNEEHRIFFNRWEEAMRRVNSHKVELPDPYKGFLLINALNLGEQDIKNMMNFTRGSISTKDVKDWVRKHETKLMAKEVGIELNRNKGKTASSSSATASVHHIVTDEHTDYLDENEIFEAALEELEDEEEENGPAGEGEGEEDETLDEHEVREVLNTLVQKRTFSQSMKLKKAKELARGYGGWKGSGKEKGKQGKSKLIDQLKQNSRCAICKRVGHWHRECPDGKGRGKSATKENYYMEKIKEEQSEEAFFCGHLEVSEPTVEENMKDFNDEKLFRLMDPEDQLDREIYGDQMRHLEEDYEPPEEAFMEQEGTVVEMDVKKDSLMPPTVTSTTSSKSPTEPEGDRKTSVFAVVSSSHSVAGQKHTSHSRYKVQCAAIGKGFEGNESEVSFVLGDSSLRGKASENHDHPKDRHRRTETSASQSSTWSESSTHDDGCATIDTGCQRMAVGADTLLRLSNHIPSSLCIGTVPQEHRFRSVNGTSTTSHLATIPTSLGHKGSILRPAIFQEGESRKAPFLISLPFLLHCRAVLYLDPQKGLRLYLRRFGFGVDCHLEPTGALRVPLNQFNKEQTKRLQQLHDQMQAGSKEFEIMKTMANEQISGSRSVGSSNPIAQSSAASSSTSCHEAQPSRREPLCVHLGPTGDQAHLRDDPIERTRPGPSWGASQEKPHRGGGLRCRDRPGGCGMGISSQSGTKQGVHAMDDTGRGGQSIDSDHALAQPSPTDTGDHLRRDALDQLPAVSRISDDSINPPGTNTDSKDSTDSKEQEPEGALQGDRGKSRKTWIDRPRELPTHSDNKKGDKCLRLGGEVPAMQQDIEIRTEVGCTRHAHQDGSQEGDTIHGRNRRGEIRGVQGVPRVPEMEEPEGSSEVRSNIHNELPGQWRELGEKNYKAMEASLRNAESYLTELMGLLSADEPICAIAKDLERIKSSSKVHRHYAKMVKGTPKTVAELFNPKRFAPYCKRSGLIAAAAFDLKLGDQLLDPGERDGVKRFFREQRPGLTIISPPCTLFSIMQNMNVDKENFQQRLREARVLLHFACEIVEIIEDYSGIYLLEQPMTSRAWMERVLQKIIKKENCILAKCDQCQFGLHDRAGGIMKKQTGWITNSPRIAEQLNRQCQGEHQHTPVLGSCMGSSRATQAQEYPPALIKAILQGYCQEIKEHHKIKSDEMEWLGLEDYKELERRVQQKTNLWLWFMNATRAESRESRHHEAHPLQDEPEQEEAEEQKEKA